MFSSKPWPLYPWKDTGYPLYRRLGGPRGQSGWEWKISAGVFVTNMFYWLFGIWMLCYITATFVEQWFTVASEVVNHQVSWNAENFLASSKPLFLEAELLHGVSNMVYVGCSCPFRVYGIFIIQYGVQLISLSCFHSLGWWPVVWVFQSSWWLVPTTPVCWM